MFKGRVLPEVVGTGMVSSRRVNFCWRSCQPGYGDEGGAIL